VKTRTCTKNYRLTSFLYSLLRDHLPAGVIERIVSDDEKKVRGGEIFLCNNHVATYAEELAERLLKP